MRPTLKCIFFISRMTLNTIDYKSDILVCSLKLLNCNLEAMI